MTNGESDEGDTPREEDYTVSKVNKSYEELKATNDKVEEEMFRAEQLRAKIAQGGKSNAGSGQLSTEKPKKISNVEYAQKLMRGEVNPLKEDGIML